MPGPGSIFRQRNYELTRAFHSQHKTSSALRTVFSPTHKLRTQRPWIHSSPRRRTARKSRKIGKS